MSLPKVLSFHLILMLSAFTGAANGYYYSRWAKCIWSSHDLSDMVFIDNYIFNKDVFIQFNSSVGEYVGYTEHGVYNAQLRNKDTNILQQERAEVEGYCKHNAEIDQSTITGKSVPPQVKLSSVTQAGGRHPAVLMCSAYDFYPQRIQISWMRDGKLVESTDVTSTEEMANGDWYYQIHSHLEYTPKSGEKISCVVEHAGLTKPLIVDWDPSLPDPERNKIAIGASGLVLGIILAAAGLIYYKKKSTGRILVPS